MPRSTQWLLIATLLAVPVTILVIGWTAPEPLGERFVLFEREGMRIRTFWQDTAINWLLVAQGSVTLVVAKLLASLCTTTRQRVFLIVAVLIPFGFAFLAKEVVYFFIG